MTERNSTHVIYEALQKAFPGFISPYAVEITLKLNAKKCLILSVDYDVPFMQDEKGELFKSLRELEICGKKHSETRFQEFLHTPCYRYSAD